MAHLLDTNVLVRLANVADSRHAVAAQAVLELHRRGEVLHITPQNLVEFRNMATRRKGARWMATTGVYLMRGWPGLAALGSKDSRTETKLLRR